MATILTARNTEAVGARTEFASTYTAFDSLPVHEREGCTGLRVAHSLEAAQRLAIRRKPIAWDAVAWRATPMRDGPLVWKRRDGRCSLAIGATADYIVDMAADESRALLDELLSWATREDVCYTHEWQPGDIVIWDSSGVLHRFFPSAVPSPGTQHRTAIAGNEAWS
jgi:alpha-ketoglutarate-dependent taurine dioxygenase